ERGEPGVVDQDVNIADSFDQALEVGWIAEVGADEARPAARSDNRCDGLGASGGVAAMDDDLCTVARQLQRNCTADAGRRACHEGLLALEVAGLGRLHCCAPNLEVQLDGPSPWSGGGEAKVRARCVKGDAELARVAADLGEEEAALEAGHGGGGERGGVRVRPELAPGLHAG